MRAEVTRRSLPMTVFDTEEVRRGAFSVYGYQPLIGYCVRHSADDLLPSYDWSGTYDSGIDPGYFPTDGYLVITEPLNVRDAGTIKDNIIEAYGYAFSSIEITRIKGTITILK